MSHKRPAAERQLVPLCSHSGGPQAATTKTVAEEAGRGSLINNVERVGLGVARLRRRNRKWSAEVSWRTSPLRSSSSMQCGLPSCASPVGSAYCQQPIKEVERPSLGEPGRSVILKFDVMPSQITNPGDAEEKRYSCHRVDRVTLDAAHHCLAPKRYSTAPRHPQGYAAHRTPPKSPKATLGEIARAHPSPASPCLSVHQLCYPLTVPAFTFCSLSPPKDGVEGKREAGGQAQDSKEYCASDKDIVEVVRTEYVYTRPPPWSDVLPTIHIITPTYSRPVQKAELTRLANTFLHVPNLHWILVEDSQRRTPLVTRLLRETGLNYTHLNVETPRNYKLRGDTRDPRIPRGTMQRNLALRWLRETFNANSSQAGIVYFADDDNTYSLELFEEPGARDIQSLLRTDGPIATQILAVDKHDTFAPALARSLMLFFELSVPSLVMGVSYSVYP
ncbi:Galactosylgalactosylxylosylprotein 3-beta-glucuronosyltransferase 1 [Liparis tanakae]|uniref:Galactosylgalactosylxylosylprotein 3-beta-glucuronosyltransferase n=1 Tax=Liparis tanakae TaxID=230148 RepID=A0A4Z2IC16_9TELE|nr:Galactosylgalactosylxylosylprotein 3-beta-glucuronosyltransferase 1 [Liparis tanakae]